MPIEYTVESRTQQVNFFLLSKILQTVLLLITLEQLLGSPRLLLDYKIVSSIGIANTLCHIAAGVAWESIRVSQVNPQNPTVYFGGYLSLIAICEMLIFIYLLLFYTIKKDKSPNLFVFRFIICVINVVVSLALFIMVVVKTQAYVGDDKSSESKQYGVVIFINVLDMFFTVYSYPSYIFIAISHYHQLIRSKEKLEKLEQIQEPQNTPKRQTSQMEAIDQNARDFFQEEIELVIRSDQRLETP